AWEGLCPLFVRARSPDGAPRCPGPPLRPLPTDLGKTTGTLPQLSMALQSPRRPLLAALSGCDTPGRRWSRTRPTEASQSPRALGKGPWDPPAGLIDHGLAVRALG